jgi:2-polyprenyl-3-methyl-5-hydroxy-6-metoxy-1,4-benzoquinol methylase
MNNDEYKNTIEAYRKMGKAYLDRIEGLTPAQFYDFLEYLPESGAILEIGCAGGRDSQKLVERGFNVTGIDMVDTFIEEAKKRVP